MNALAWSCPFPAVGGIFASVQSYDGGVAGALVVVTDVTVMANQGNTSIGGLSVTVLGTSAGSIGNTSVLIRNVTAIDNVAAGGCEKEPPRSAPSMSIWQPVSWLVCGGLVASLCPVLIWRHAMHQEVEVACTSPCNLRWPAYFHPM